MKVTHNPSPAPHTIDKSKTAERAKAGKDNIDPFSQTHESAHPGANIDISDNARLLQRASDVVRSTPDVRQEKVAALKKSIADGSYKVDSAAVAEKLVDEHLQTDFGKNQL